MTVVFRPSAGRLLAAIISAGCVVGMIATIATGTPDDVARVAPWIALAGVVAVAAFWIPCVEVTDGGVRLVNVTRTIDLPWPAITDIETRWALTVVTAYGRYSAWAAPAPGATAFRRSRIEEFRKARRDAPGGSLPVAEFQPTELRLGDLPESPSGEAATVVRHRWEQLRRAGHLNDPHLEHQRAPVRWHWPILLLGVALAALGVAAQLL